MIDHSLRIAVGISGNIVFLENYPKEERFEGLHEMVQDLERDTTLDQEAGLYLVNLQITDNLDRRHVPDWDYDAYLEIKEIIPIMTTS